MKEDLITFETAKLAKEKGFDLIVTYFYSDYSENKYTLKEIKDKNYNIEKRMTSAPTQSLLQKWLRVEHKLDVIVSVVYTGDGKRYHCDLFTTYMSSLPSIFDTYEEAFKEGLQEALKLI